MQRAILGTPRLVAVMWEPDDAGLIHELHSMIETTRYLSGAAPWSREKAEERLRNWFGEQERDGATKYKILSRDDGRFIGRAGFSLLGRERQDFELGYSLRFQEWGKGYATEIAGELAKWIEELRGVRCRVVTRPGNRPVPLRAAFLMPDKRLIPMLDESGKLNREIAAIMQQRDESRRPRRSFRR